MGDDTLTKFLWDRGDKLSTKLIRIIQYQKRKIILEKDGWKEKK